ncbi:MAG TPA: hypothetical protein PLS69_01135 [Terricaulis sp.]|nr:hypothetical protein [Terricaulis sp.]
MSFAARVASLHPLIISGLFIAGIAAAVAQVNWAPVLAFLLLWYVWTPCVYIAMRNATNPAPQVRHPVFAILIFAMAIGGAMAVLILPRLGLLDSASSRSPAPILIGVAIGFGTLASFWVTADALVKAETGRSALADPHAVRVAFYGFLVSVIGVWFLHPRIKRVLSGD